MTKNSEADIAQHILDNISKIVFEDFLAVSAHSIRFELDGIKFSVYSYSDNNAHIYMKGYALEVAEIAAAIVYKSVTAEFKLRTEIKRVTTINEQRKKLGLKEYVVADSKEEPVVSKPRTSNTPNLEDILNRDRDEFKPDTIFDKFKAWIFK